MLDDYGRLDLKLNVIVSVMDGFAPPPAYTVAWLDYFHELIERIDERCGEDAWSAPQLLAGFSCEEFDQYDWFRAKLHFSRDEALALIRKHDPKNFPSWAKENKLA